MTDQDRMKLKEEIKLEVLEEMAVKMPEIMGNLIKHNAHIFKMKDKFKKDQFLVM